MQKQAERRRKSRKGWWHESLDDGAVWGSRPAKRGELQGCPGWKEIFFFVFSTKLVDTYRGVRVWTMEVSVELEEGGVEGWMLEFRAEGGIRKLALGFQFGK